MSRDWCKFFAGIEADHTAIAPTLTVREYMQARDHVQSCDSCFNRTERVLAKHNHTNTIGFNQN